MKVITHVKLKQLIADPEQPRQEFDADEMDRLKSSIKEKGIMVPLIVEKTKKKGIYLVVDGERRFRTAKRLKLTTIPVKIVSEQNSAERMIMRFHLQDQHSNWSVFDRARAIAFFKELQKLTNVETAELLGISKVTVANWTSILNLSKRSQAFIVERRIPFSYASKIRTLTSQMQKICSYKPEEIEMKLLNKYENGTLRDISTFWKVTKLFTHGKDDNRIIEFMDKSEMTVSNLLGKTEMGSSIQLDTLVYKARAFMRACTVFRRQTKGDKIKTTEFQKKTLTETVKKIEELL